MEYKQFLSSSQAISTWVVLSHGYLFLFLYFFIFVSLFVVIFGAVTCLERFISKNNVFSDVTLYSLVLYLHANYAMHSQYYFLAATSYVRQCVCPFVCTKTEKLLNRINMT